MVIILTARSPDMLAPARIPVAAGKKMENTEKNDSPSRKSGPQLSLKTLPVNVQNIKKYIQNCSDSELNN